MTTEEKIKIREMRLKGIGYKAIATELNIARDAVRSFCKRNHLDGTGEVAKLNYEESKGKLCLNCGTKLINSEGRGRKKLFCSDKCRAGWWSRHPKSSPSVVVKSCAGCGRKFKSKKSANRKYCSYNCYQKTRFGGTEND